MNNIRLMPFALLLIILPIPGTVAARLLLLVTCFGIALWQWWRIPGARTKIPCKATLGIWIVVCFGSLFYAFDVAYTLGELKNEVGYTMMISFAFFVIAKDRDDATRVLRAIAVGLAVMGTWGIITWAGNRFVWVERGTLGGSGAMSTYLITIIPALVWLAIEERSRMLRRVAIGFGIFGFFVAAITMQRAVWFVFAVQAAITLAMAARAGMVVIPRRAILAATAAIAAIAMAGTLLIQEVRYGGFNNPQVQLITDVRLKHWPKVAATISDRPLSGSGFGRDMIRKEYPNLTPADVPLLWHAHNIFLNYGLEMGIPGMIAVTALFAGLSIMFWSASTGPSAWAGIVGLALVAGVLTRNQVNDFFIRDMSLLFWALTGLFARVALTRTNDRQKDAGI